MLPTFASPSAPRSAAISQVDNNSQLGAWILGEAEKRKCFHYEYYETQCLNLGAPIILLKLFICFNGSLPYYSGGTLEYNSYGTLMMAPLIKVVWLYI